MQSTGWASPPPKIGSGGSGSPSLASMPVSCLLTAGETCLAPELDVVHRELLCSHARQLPGLAQAWSQAELAKLRSCEQGRWVLLNSTKAAGLITQFNEKALMQILKPPRRPPRVELLGFVAKRFGIRCGITRIDVSHGRITKPIFLRIKNMKRLATSVTTPLIGRPQYSPNLSLRLGLARTTTWRPGPVGAARISPWARGCSWAARPPRAQHTCMVLRLRGQQWLGRVVLALVRGVVLASGLVVPQLVSHRSPVR